MANECNYVKIIIIMQSKSNILLTQCIIQLPHCEGKYVATLSKGLEISRAGMFTLLCRVQTLF